MRTTPINAYLYQQFKDDKDLSAFVQAYNAMSQEYVDWFNSINLPIYTSPQCSGLMLDWVAEGIYGIKRQNLSSGNSITSGQLNSSKINTDRIDASAKSSTLQTIEMTDDIFKRVLTWNLYRGDGHTFSVQWLKRRVLRFILGANGADIIERQGVIGLSNTGAASIANPEILPLWTKPYVALTGTQIVSVQFNALNAVTIQYRTGTSQVPMVNVLNACFNNGILDLPMQYTFNITAV